MRSRPDFYLCETASGSQVLTPFSALGRMAYDGIKGPYRSIGDALLLSREEGSFVLQVLRDNHYRVIERPFDRQPSTQVFTSTVVDTRPDLTPRPFLGYMHGLLQKQPLSKRDLQVLRSFKCYRHTPIQAQLTELAGSLQYDAEFLRPIHLQLIASLHLQGVASLLELASTGALEVRAGKQHTFSLAPYLHRMTEL